MYTVDASVWINAFDQRKPGHEASRQFLDIVRLRSLSIIVPTLVLVTLDNEQLTRLTGVIPAVTPAAAVAELTALP